MKQKSRVCSHGVCSHHLPLSPAPPEMGVGGSVCEFRWKCSLKTWYRGGGGALGPGRLGCFRISVLTETSATETSSVLMPPTRK